MNENCINIKTKKSDPAYKYERGRIKDLFFQFITKQSDPVSIWKTPDVLNTKFSLKEQIDLLFQSVCLDANKAACSEFKCQSVENLLGNKFNSLSTNKNYRNLFAEFIQNNYSLKDHQTINILNDGSEYCSIENWFGIIEHNKLVYFCVVSKDITKYKWIKQNIEPHLFETDQILDSMLTGFILINADGQLIRANPAYCEMTGYSEEELRKMKINDLEVKISSDRSSSQAKKIGKYSSARFEAKHKHKDGHLLEVDINMVFVKFKGNSFIAGFIKDVTEHKNYERVLQQEKNKAQNYLDIAGVIILALDKNGTVILINQKGSEILGYKQNKIIGKNWFNTFLPATFKNEVRNVINKIMNNEIEPYQNYINPILTRDGDEKLIAWHNALLKDEQGNIIGLLSSGEDITLRKKYEDQLKTHRDTLKNLVRERTKELEESNRKLKKKSDDLETFNKVMLDRELRIVEMKKEVNALCMKFGLEIKYPPLWDK
ncbi:MAG TPA: PAS domain-containing sensor histidine kinase [Caldithrix sp.]|nr:PAS domain-containing sensor histidine kinase [Caldithrix sp.]